VTIAAIILAAGRSSRMTDACKLMLRFGDSTVIQKTIENVLAGAFAETILVTGHQHREVAALAPPIVKVVHNAVFADGLATSVHAGVKAARTDVDGYLFCLGDMPMIKPATLRLLAQSFNPGAGTIVVPVQGEHDGNPVLFDCGLRNELLRLSGDAGAKRIMRAHPDHVVRVPVDDLGIHQDIDTPADYEALMT
jgi:molybdenum cofactor cytidylyltransferase